MSTMEHVLITGANGALGSAVVRCAQAAGLGVRAFVLEGSALGPLEDIDVEVLWGDVRDVASLEAAFSDVELCIHTAGDTSFYRGDRSRLRAVNAGGTKNVVSVASRRGVRRLVYTSSVGAVGHDPSGREVDEDESWNWPPGLAYMETKRDGEAAALSAANDAFEVVALCPCTIFGPGPLNPGDEEIVEALRTRRLFFAPPGGTTLCDVVDVAEAHVAALERGRSGQRYILGGPSVSYAKLFRALARALGVSPPRFTLPLPIARASAVGLARLEDLGLRPPVPAAAVLLSSMHLYYSSERAVTTLGYRVRTLEDIARRTASGH